MSPARLKENIPCSRLLDSKEKRYYDEHMTDQEPTKQETQPEASAGKPADHSLEAERLLERVAAALVAPMGNPVTLLQEMDDAFQKLQRENPAAATALLDRTARDFLRPERMRIFEGANFQASLLDRPRSFFGQVVFRMAGLMDADPTLTEHVPMNVRVRAVEAFRRAGRGEEMRKMAGRVEAELRERVEQGDSLACRWLGSAQYEVSMGEYNEKKYGKAIAAAHSASAYSRRGAHLPGALQADGNIGGLFLLGQGQDHEDAKEKERLWREGAAICEAALREAEQGMAAGGELHEQFARVVMNEGIHMIELGLLLHDKSIVRKGIESLTDENPVVRNVRGQEWFDEPIGRGKEFLGE